jgi:hypothetical protein
MHKVDALSCGGELVEIETLTTKVLRGGVKK